MTKFSIASLALVAAFSTINVAQADGLSRAEVVAELQRARASGELEAMHSENPDAITAVSAISVRQAAARSSAPMLMAKPQGKSRAEVLAELQRARETGELDELQSEGGPGYYPVARSQVTGQPLLARLRGKQ